MVLIFILIKLFIGKFVICFTDKFAESREVKLPLQNQTIGDKARLQTEIYLIVKPVLSSVEHLEFIQKNIHFSKG
jgi:hypothetical protein